MRRTAIAVSAVLALLTALLAGTARAEASTVVYTWPHATGRWPVVFVENHTDGRWPVTAAVVAWGSGLHVGRCRAGAGCIRITSPSRGRSAPLGQSSVYAAGKAITRVDISMNASDEAQPAAVRTVATEHELGHALGLGHDRSYHGIMGPVAWGYDRINAYARAELAGRYGR